MDAATVALLLGAGLAGGVITAVVGGSSLITFPAMLAVGLPPVAASASNTVSMLPSNFIAAMADYKRLPQWRPAFPSRTTRIPIVLGNPWRWGVPVRLRSG